MATAPAMPAPAIHPGLSAGQILAREQARLAEPAGDPAAATAAEAALIPSEGRDRGAEQLVLAAPLARMPVELDVAIPIPDFRVRNLLALTPGQLIQSEWGSGEDVPLASGGVQLAWTEFEVIDTLMAVRITRLG